MEEHIYPLPRLAKLPSLHTIAVASMKCLFAGLFMLIIIVSHIYIGLLAGIIPTIGLTASVLVLSYYRLTKQSSQDKYLFYIALITVAMVSNIFSFLSPMLLTKGLEHYILLLDLALFSGLGCLFSFALAWLFKHKLINSQACSCSDNKLIDNSTHQALITEQSSPYAKLGLRHFLQAACISALIKLLSSGFGMISTWLSSTKVMFNGQLTLNLNWSTSPALLGLGYMIGFRFVAFAFLGCLLASTVDIINQWTFSQQLTEPLQQTLPALSIKALTLFDGHYKQQFALALLLACLLWSMGKLTINLLSRYLQWHNKQSLTKQKVMGKIQHNTALLALSISLFVALNVAFHFSLDNEITSLANSITLSLACFLLAFISAFCSIYMSRLKVNHYLHLANISLLCLAITCLIFSFLFEEQTKQIAQQASSYSFALVFFSAFIISACLMTTTTAQNIKLSHKHNKPINLVFLVQGLALIFTLIVLPLFIELFAVIKLDQANNNLHGLSILAMPQLTLINDAKLFFLQFQFDSGIFIGCFCLGLVIMAIEEFQKRRHKPIHFHLSLIALGAYLPLGIAGPIFIGSLINHIITKKSNNKSSNEKALRVKTGHLLCTGLIAGEAAMSLVLLLVFLHLSELAPLITYSHITAFISVSFVCLYLYKRSKSDVD